MSASGYFYGPFQGGERVLLCRPGQEGQLGPYRFQLIEYELFWLLGHDITHDPRLPHPVNWVIRSLIPYGGLDHCFEARLYLFHAGHIVSEEDSRLSR
jgi:hypothetical protein